MRPVLAFAVTAALFLVPARAGAQEARSAWAPVATPESVALTATLGAAAGALIGYSLGQGITTAVVSAGRQP